MRISLASDRATEDISAKRTINDITAEISEGANATCLPQPAQCARKCCSLYVLLELTMYLARSYNSSYVIISMFLESRLNNSNVLVLVLFVRSMSSFT